MNYHLLCFRLRLNGNDEKNTVLGYARVGDTIIVVRWPWLSLLAAQVFLTILFLVHVIVDTALIGVEVVKSSNLAELRADASTRPLNGGIASQVDNTLVGKLVKVDDLWVLQVEKKDFSSNKGSS